jgi:hypothetical protein
MTPRFGLAPLGFLEAVPPPEPIGLAAEAEFASVTLRTRPAVRGGAALPMRNGDPLLRACRRRRAETAVSIGAIEQVGLERIPLGRQFPELDARKRAQPIASLVGALPALRRQVPLGRT